MIRKKSTGKNQKACVRVQIIAQTTVFSCNWWGNFSCPLHQK